MLYFFSIAVESFVDVYRGLQNGTEADAPANHLIDIIESLQEEVDDIILGFQASIGQIRSTLLDKLVLSDTSEDVDGTNSKSLSFFFRLLRLLPLNLN